MIGNRDGKTSSREKTVAGATRLELATSGVTGRRSNQIELRPRALSLDKEPYCTAPGCDIKP